MLDGCDWAERAIVRHMERRGAFLDIKPHELVEALAEKGVRHDVGATCMWDLIGRGVLDLSDEWTLSLNERS